jgi:hypothetical protein
MSRPERSAPASRSLARPVEIDLASWLWILGGVLGTVSSVAGSVDQFTHLDRREMSWPDLGIGVGITVVVVALSVLVGLRMRGGCDWARQVVLVLALLGLVALAWSAYQGFRFVSVWSLLSMLPGLAAGAVLMLPAARAWFSRPAGPAVE